VGPEVVPLLDHQHEDDRPDDGTEPGPGQATLQPQVVSEGDVLKVAHVRDLVVVVPEAVVLGVELVVAVVLFQLVMVDFVSE